MSYNILIIEDNEEMAENICCILQLAKYNVMHASNGKAGVDLVQKNHPDLILCDIMMPELDGYGVVYILNNDPETANIPFIFLTAKADLNDFRAGMNLGADDYITKPFDGIDLLKVVEKRLRKKEILKSAFANAVQDTDAFFGTTRALKDFHKLSENRPVRTFKRKDLIFMEGQTPNDLYFIQKGQVKTYKINYDGKELITRFLKEGDFIGYASLFGERTYSEYAEVLEEARVSIIPRSDFLALIYSSKDVVRKFMKVLSNDLVEIENKLIEIAYQPVRQRVANVLLKLNETLEAAKKGTIITVTRRDMSNVVGTATESLNRTLADFKDEGLIEISGEGLKIINKSKLERLSH